MPKSGRLSGSPTMTDYGYMIGICCETNQHSLTVQVLSGISHRYFNFLGLGARRMNTVKHNVLWI